MAGNSGPYDRALLFPSNNLLFCGIPKAGITQWLQFLRFTLGAKDYQSSPYSKFDARLFYFDKVHPKHHGHIWKNFTKAILLREPAERLLSAYLDKVALKPRIMTNDTQQQHTTRRQCYCYHEEIEIKSLVTTFPLPSLSTI